MSQSQQVRRRRVFYIPGYDPFPPRRYRELYRKEGAAQAAISGYALTIGPQAAGGSYGWRATARIGGQEAEAEIAVLYWADLVRASMGQSILSTYGQLARTAWIFGRSGALRRLARLRKGPTIAALYPVLALLAELLVAALAGAAAGLTVARFLPAFIAQPAAWLAGAAVLAGVLVLFRRADRWLFAYYLMHDYAHSAALQGAYPVDLEARLAAFGAEIAAALGPEGKAGEVLVIGHSSGAHLAVSVLADLIRAGRVPKDGPALALLTLGQVVPMISFLPKAQRLRGDLAFLSARDEITWIDVTAPGDGCAFALCDPVSVTGVAPEGKRWPLVLSAAFTQTLSPERWKALRWRFFRLHFQYLCAFDRPGDYDYFAITAGPMTLASRFAGRAPSKSRIERVESPHRDLP